jgi:NADPH:quinone reductase-like Zn-dependent oxidoreductase
MRAAAFFEYGPAEVLRYAEVADPQIGPQDVLVRVLACGVNHSDLDSSGWRILGFRVAPPDELAAALELIRLGRVQVPVAATFGLAEAAAAHRFLERRQHVGKVLLVAG